MADKKTFFDNEASMYYGLAMMSVVFLVSAIIVGTAIEKPPSPPVPRQPVTTLDSLYYHVEEIRVGVQGVTAQLTALCLELALMQRVDPTFCDVE